VTRIDLLVEAIWERITPELDKLDPVVTCPDCRQLALVVDDPLRCRFCERLWTPAEAAEECAAEIVGVNLPVGHLLAASPSRGHHGNSRSG
jgi:hypothetical protein